MARIAFTLFVITAAVAGGAAAQQVAIRSAKAAPASAHAVQRVCETESLDTESYGLVCFNQT